MINTPKEDKNYCSSWRLHCSCYKRTIDPKNLSKATIQSMQKAFNRTPARNICCFCGKENDKEKKNAETN